MPVDLRAAHRAWSSYSGTGAALRAFFAARLLVAPLGPLEPELSRVRGRVLSLGCGFGVIERYLAELNPNVTIDGIDIDAGRVEVASATNGRCSRVRVTEADGTRFDGGEAYDVTLAIDVMHHIEAARHQAAAESLARSLRPGGLCLVKDIATTPRWQHGWNRAHDRLVAGREPIWCRAPEDMREVFRRAGLEPDGGRRLSRFSPYPHYLISLRKPD